MDELDIDGATFSMQGGALHVIRCDPVEIEAGHLCAGQLTSSKRIADAGDRRLLETKLALLRTSRHGRSHQHRTDDRHSNDTSHRCSPHKGQGNKLSSKADKIG
jgi:hypothetical protein